MFHCILTRQCRVDARALARWTHSAFRAYGVSTQAFFQQLFLIEWLMPFTGVRHSTNGHRAVFHRILPQQCCIGAHALARWTHSVFCAYGVPTLAFFHQRLLDRMPYALRKYP